MPLVILFITLLFSSASFAQTAADPILEGHGRLATRGGASHRYVSHFPAVRCAKVEKVNRPSKDRAEIEIVGGHVCALPGGQNCESILFSLSIHPRDIELAEKAKRVSHSVCFRLPKGRDSVSITGSTGSSFQTRYRLPGTWKFDAENPTALEKALAAHQLREPEETQKRLAPPPSLTAPFPETPKIADPVN